MAGVISEIQEKAPAATVDVDIISNVVVAVVNVETRVTPATANAVVLPSTPDEGTTVVVVVVVVGQVVIVSSHGVVVVVEVVDVVDVVVVVVVVEVAYSISVFV